MKKLPIYLLSAVLALTAVAGCSKYESVKGDPLDAKIYTLSNGLKVYMTVNKEEPRLQTYIAVRVGGKNDPADNTGLAHYLEHIMFKGTQQLGTSNYEAEKPLLDRIEAEYNVYRTLTDPEQRKAQYRIIDSLSYEASRYAIPNEYDKAMSLIGAQGSNAFTSNDVTCYQEDIPSNQIENWAKVQSDRFKNMVVRGFHTELEAVYEEKNRGLNNDSNKAVEALDSMLFTHHPYGTQTVIGTQEHLKNPSITAIKHQKDVYYVPNNVAICVSGDFDPDEFVKIIEKYFGDWQPNNNLPTFEITPEEPITAPRVKDVYGTEGEFAFLAWRYPGAATADAQTAGIVSAILSNGLAGLIDLDVNQTQSAIGAFAENYDRTDYGEFILGAFPKYGQSLEAVRDLLLEEVGKLRRGEFSDSLLTGAVNNYKLAQMRSLERNSSRAMTFVDAFVNGQSWKDEVAVLGNLEKLTKEDIVAWANKYLGDENYAIVFKHHGIDTSIRKIEAPAITPILTNRDKQSAFLSEIQASKVKPIEPVFVDFSKDMSLGSSQGQELLYKKNEVNDITNLQFRYNLGLLDDPAWGLAFEYLDYLGTPAASAQERALELYNLGCSIGAHADDNNLTVSVRGLSENIPAALDIVEDLFANAIIDEEILENLKTDELQSRHDTKLSQRACNSALRDYVVYGPEYITRTTLSNKALNEVSAEELVSKVKALKGFGHSILYYGPTSEGEVVKVLEEHHNVPADAVALEKKFPAKRTVSSPVVYLAPYAARQFNYIQYSNRGEAFEKDAAAGIRLFNNYFGSGMNAVVFQEMRESRALAYSAGANLSSPSFSNDSYSFAAYIGSQNDKLSKAVEAFAEIIEHMPESDKAFEIAKTNLDTDLRTARTNGMAVLGAYLRCRDLGLDEPLDKTVFEGLSSMTLDSLKAVHGKWIAGRTYSYGILGDPTDLDVSYLKTLGPVKILSLEEIFGY